MINEPVDTISKERRHQAYHTTLLICHKHPNTHPNAHPDLITSKLHYHFAPSITCSHAPSINHNYVQMIVQATSPQSMNLGVWCDNFRYTRSVILEAIHMLPWINTSIVVKKGNGTQSMTKVSLWSMPYSCCRW